MSDPEPTQPARVRLALSAAVSDAALNALFAAGWPDFEPRSFGPVLERSLCWVTAHAQQQLIGFVNLAWDGGVHAFLLDPTVHPDYRRKGVGSALVQTAVEEARRRGLEWVHVDHEAQLGSFYRRCGFQPTGAGLIALRPTPEAGAGEPAEGALIRQYAAGDRQACDALMAGLAEWFQIPEAKAAYVADLARFPSWVLASRAAPGEVLGFLTLTRPAPRAFEIHVLAVSREHHRCGFGRLLVEHAERWAAARGSKFLQLKTLGPSHPDPFYAQTRAFYAALGYTPLFESAQLWGGADNPALVLVKALH